LIFFIALPFVYAQNFLAGILDCNIHEPHIWGEGATCLGIQQ